MQQMAPVPQAPQMQLRQPTLMERFSGLNDTIQSPLFLTGLSLLGRAQNGGDWAGAAQDIMGINAQQQQRQLLERQQRREDTQDQRETEQWSWTREERTSTAERRRLAAQYIASRPEAEQAELRMIDPDQLGAYLQDQRSYNLQERGLEAQMAEMQQRSQFHRDEMGLGYARLGQDRYNNTLQGQLGRAEADFVTGMRSRLDNWRLIDNDLGRISYWLERRPDVFSSLADGDEEAVLRRWTQRGDPEGLTAAQELFAITTSLAREELRGQTPVSNIDLITAIRGMPTTASTPQFVRSWLERAGQDRSQMERQYQSALSYAREHGTLNTPAADGRSWYEQNYQNYNGGTTTAPPPQQQRAQSPEALAAQRELERRGIGDVPNNRVGSLTLLRQPENERELAMVRSYRTAVRLNQTGMMRRGESDMRRAGLIR